MTRINSIVAAVAVAGLCSSGMAGVIVNTGTVGVFWPASPTVQAAHPNNASDNLDPFNPPLHQSFTIGQGGSNLDAIYYEYARASAGESFSLRLRTTDNVAASSVSSMSLGSDLLSSISYTFTGTEPVDGIIKFDLTNNDEVALPAGGYLLTVGLGSGDLTWVRAGGAGSTYTGGQVFQTDNALVVSGGTRDATLAVTTVVPEPASLATLSVLAIGGLIRRRRA